GPVARPVDDGQDLAGVGQRQHKRVVAPGAVVGDVHALLALAGGLDQGAVHVDARLREEGVRLRGPDADADVVEGVEQAVNVGAAEAAAEVAGGGRVGDAAGTEGV